MVKKFILVSICMSILLAGCIKPYKERKYVEVKPYETAYVIPLQDEMAKQVKFNSISAYEKMKVAAKRVEIPQIWHQTGRMSWQGKWIPSVIVITVDRTPVTREFTADKAKGTRKLDDGVWIESSDSVTFSTGFTITAYISEEDASTFLYMYPNKSLSEIIDTEVRAVIQSESGNISNSYIMDDLRAKKNEMIENVRSISIPFFKERGITITTLGMFGGFTYQNADIQKKIDAVFEAQQEKEIAKAMLNAQNDKNLKIELEAKAIANAAVTKAEGEGKSVTVKAQAQADAIELIAKAAEQAAKNPVFIQIKELENEAKRIEVWDGRYPTHYWTTGDTEGLGIIVNTPK